MIEAVTAAGSLALAIYLRPGVQRIFEGAKVIRRNYRGVPVTPSLGMVISLAFIPGLALLGIAEAAGDSVLLITVAVVGMSFIGLLDDINDEKTRGFRGHFRSWKEGYLTAGFLKAVWGGALALLIVISVPGGVLHRIIGVLTIVFWANGINQLDRRPGRSLKSFILLSFVILILLPEALEPATLSPLVLLLVIAFALLPADLSGTAMLGDSGSNALGAFLGVYAFLVLPLNGQLIWLFLGFILNLAGEMFSLSAIIEHNRFLGFLDRLGREGEMEGRGGQK